MYTYIYICYIYVRQPIKQNKKQVQKKIYCRTLSEQHFMTLINTQRRGPKLKFPFNYTKIIYDVVPGERVPGYIVLLRARGEPPLQPPQIDQFAVAGNTTSVLIKNIFHVVLKVLSATVQLAHTPANLSPLLRHKPRHRPKVVSSQ